MAAPQGNGVPPGPPVGFPSAAPGMVVLPPLAPNWSEHRAPNGTPYYYNNVTKQSTYTRPPVPPPGVMPPFAPGMGVLPIAGAMAPAVAAAPKKKEKPKEKIPIPNTTWTKVITTEGNVFYTEKTSKKSSWTIPEDIKEEVEAYEAEQRAQRIREEEEARLKAEEEKAAAERERERIRKELEEERRRKQQEEEKKRRAFEQERAENEKKRKAEGADGSGEDEASRPAKVPKLEGEDETQDAAVEEEDDDEGQAGPEDADDEEAWQRAVAAELAVEHAEQQAIKNAEKKAKKQAEEEARVAVFNAPTKVEFTTEEARALFKALLYDKNISHLAPWETSLPHFINDPRYVLLKSMKDRQDVFEEYCREVARARRLGKSSSSMTTEQQEKRDPEKEYRDLLKAEVKSTRMSWDDFKRAWKKDRRFFAFGRDDRQREKAFRAYQKELGERKRADAKRAESDFMELLQEQGNVTADSKWAEVKRPLVRDPRYDAVGSSSLREELFNRYQSNLGASAALTPEDEAEKKAKEKKARAEASLREREQQVKQKQQQMERDLHRSKQGANREEAEREFGSLLVQAIREHNVSWSDALPLLDKDPRFQHPGLSLSDKQRLFHSHLEGIARKRLDALHKLFESHAPKLNTPFEDVFPEIVNDFAVTRLNLTPEKLEQRFEQWQQVRFQAARKDFEALLRENSFVDFWGRMRNKHVDEKAYIPENEDEDDEYGAEGGGKANLANMAKSVDLKEMHAVLKNDKRYRQFDHIPTEREQWMRDYLSTLSEASGTIHVPPQ
ncbi:hypothetical protein QFC20_002358 [Naganishia adeliensis]|uniref:Uncharacterized protein n=1 Tax=Naganishia adeliensis TaxID=92952 RepID=A0ACC2WKK7_9TREE|nr:hypothetical protein QFC20_002358 [Naganishia adeliensis]